MCLAIFKPAKVSIPQEHLRNGWIGNSNGGGYAFVNKKKLTVRKGIMTLKEFEEAISKDLKQYSKSPFVIHFRIRSQGDMSAENTHPFNIAGGVLIHNGTLDGTGAMYGTGESDTSKFCNLFGDKFTHAWVEENKAALERAIGDYNKFVMLYENGKHHIINEKAGNWSGDVWYSNHSYKPRLSAYSGGSCSTGTCQ
jgi:predicted glutamine amidotransferase